MYKQLFTPDISLKGIGYAGLCLQWVDDAGKSPNRSNTAKAAYENEVAHDRKEIGDIPEGIYVPIWFEFTKGSFTYPNGETVEFKDAWHVAHAIRHGIVYTIYDSEVAYGARQPYKSLAELEGWFRVYGAKYVGWSTHCDGREYATKEESMTQDAVEKLVTYSYRAATDIDPTKEQAGYWVERIRDDNNRAYELLSALGGATYRGDPAFREKARNYDKDLKAAQNGSGYVPAGELFVKIK